jgi:acetyltransferase-like isoleucine patch superfamily enzyme
MSAQRDSVIAWTKGPLEAVSLSENPLSVAIFGGNGGGSLAAQTLLQLAREGQPYRLAGYLNDRLAAGTALYGGKVLCSFNDWSLLDRDLSFVAPLHKVGHMQQNAMRILGLGIPCSRWTRLIDPRAAVAKDVCVGLGSIIGPFVSIDTETTVGTHSYVRPGAVVGHAAKIGDFVYVGPNTVICGFAQVETGTHIAPGATVRGDVKVGRFAVVGLGAVVTKNVRDYAVVAGNPARVQGEVEPIDLPC